MNSFCVANTGNTYWGAKGQQPAAAKKPAKEFPLEEILKEKKAIKEYDFDVDALWAYLEKIFHDRIVILDGGMGTQLQTYKL